MLEVIQSAARADSYLQMRALRNFIIVVAVGSVALVGYTSYAITAANTVSDSTAGDGSAAVNAYTVSGITYTTNANTTYKLDQLVFTLAPTAAATVKVRYNTRYYTCTNVAGTATCNMTVGFQAVVNAANTMSVIAAT